MTLASNSYLLDICARLCALAIHRTPTAPSSLTLLSLSGTANILGSQIPLHLGGMAA